MHEIPNLPFPSLNHVEQKPAPINAEPAQSAEQQGDEPPRADQE